MAAFRWSRSNLVREAWTPLLYTAGSWSGYGFAVLAPADRDIARLIGAQGGSGLLTASTETEAQWILGAVGDRIFFGRWGRLADWLDSDDPAATDRHRRPLRFFLGYSAPRGTTAPGFDELEAVESVIAADLRRFTADDAGARTLSNPPPTLFGFTRSKAGMHPWDHAAAELDRTGRCMPLVIDETGKARMARAAPPEIRAEENVGEVSSSASEYKLEPESHPPRNGWILAGCATALVAAAAAILFVEKRQP